MGKFELVHLDLIQLFHSPYQKVNFFTVLSLIRKQCVRKMWIRYDRNGSKKSSETEKERKRIQLFFVVVY